MFLNLDLNKLVVSSLKKKWKEEHGLSMSASFRNLVQILEHVSVDTLTFKGYVIMD